METWLDKFTKYTVSYSVIFSNMILGRTVHYLHSAWLTGPLTDNTWSGRVVGPSSPLMCYFTQRHHYAVRYLQAVFLSGSFRGNGHLYIRLYWAFLYHVASSPVANLLKIHSIWTEKQWCKWRSGGYLVMRIFQPDPLQNAPINAIAATSIISMRVTQQLGLYKI